MSTELPPPPPPPPEGDNSAPQAPKLKLAKPVAAIPPPPPPPAPSAALAAAPLGATAPTASTPRPSPSFNSAKDRGVTKTEALVDVVTLVASLVAVFFLAVELFTKSKG